MGKRFSVRTKRVPSILHQSKAFAALVVVLLGIVTVGSKALAAAETRTNAASFLFRSWRTPDGLPQNSVQALAQTPDGYLWVGTKGGLARFDGVRFTTYGLADGLKGLVIIVLLEDGQGGLWIGTLGGGLSHWTNGTISTLTMADGLAHNDVMALALADDGGLWVGTKGGLQHLGPKGFTRVGGAEGLKREIVALANQPGKGLWITVEEKGLFYLHDGRCEPVAGPPQRELFHGYSLVLDQAGALWVSIGNGMVLRRDAGKWTVFNEMHGLPYSYVYCLAEGAPGEIWAGSAEAGLHVFREGRFHAVPTSEASIRAVWMGRDGVVWAGLQSEGLCRLTPRSLTTVPVGGDKRRGRVTGLVEDPAGELWVASYGGGLHHGPLDRLEAAPDVKELREHPHLLAGLRMSDGTLYFAGAMLLLRQETLTGELRPINLPRNFTALCEAADGSLLFGTREGEFKRLMNDVPQPVANWTPLAPITALVRGSKASVWVATSGAGLFRWDAGTLQRWTIAEGLPTDVVQTLYQDATGTLWIGTGGGGLAWLEGGRLHTVNSRQGLGDDVISQILEDDQENLWLGCHRGIFRVSKRELRAVATGQAPAVHPLALDESDGMLAAECTGGYSPAGLRSSTGLLHFSTVRGIVAVDPKQFGSSGAPPTVLIEEVLLNGRPLRLTGQPLTLPPWIRELEIRYTAFNYTKPEQIRFRHRLGGREGRWTESEGLRSVRYSQLPADDYRFLVTAANQDGRWHETGAGLAFTVRPFYWQTMWFRAGLAFLFIGSGGAGVGLWARARLRRAADREKTAGEMRDLAGRLITAQEVERTRLARELHDDLSQSLALLSVELEMFGQKPPAESERITGRMQEFSSEVKGLSSEVHRLSHELHPAKLEQLGLAAAVRGFCRELSAAHAIAIEFEPRAVPRVLPKDVALCLYRITQEALQNVVKHSGAAGAKVELMAGEREIRLVVTDDGQGFDVDLAQGRESLGLVSMRERVRMVQGRLTVHSRPGEGTRIEVRVPFVALAGTAEE